MVQEAQRTMQLTLYRRELRFSNVLSDTPHTAWTNTTSDAAVTTIAETIGEGDTASATARCISRSL